MSYYVKIFDSPRSNSLPQSLEMKTLDLKKEHQNFFSIYRYHNFTSVLSKLKDVRDSQVWVEYSGNPFANLVITLALLFRRNKIALDCHNSAIERSKGKLLRFLTSISYLKIMNLAFKVRIIVHNDAIQRKLRTASVVYTPNPALPEVASLPNKNDVLFLCSLNSDEPQDLILAVCTELHALGYKVKVTGNPNKNKLQDLTPYLFDSFLSYEDYLSYLYNSHLSVCLSERAETLLYAPREALVLGVKCLINDSQVNQDFYKDKCFYSPLSSEQLVANITRILDEA